MTVRDRLVVIVVAAAAVLATFWFLALAPKRDEAKKVGGLVSVQRERLTVAQQSAATAEAAHARYDRDYATVARLGKAVPVDDEVPSLVYQLEQAAKRNHIDFRSIHLEAGAAAAAPPAASQATAVTSASASPAGASTATPAAATQAAAAVLPPGASVGAAGFPTMPFSFSFEGSFFDMERFLSAVNKFTKTGLDSIRVHGRLLTVDAVSLTASPKGFPQVSADISATAYLLPQDEGLTAGATSTAPVSATGSPTTPTIPAPTGGTQ